MCIVLVIGFKLVAGAIASNAFTGVAIGVGFSVDSSDVF